ncbi:MAG: hypothetical protein Q6K81_00150 [Gloeomargarita sp. DG02_5_bins_242]
MRCKSGLVALFLSTLAATLPVQPVWSQSNWLPFTPPAGQFQVELPVAPSNAEVKDHSLVGTVTTQIFTAKAEEATFSVSYSDLPALAVQFMGADGLFGQAKASLLRDQNGREISFSPATLNGLSGKRLLYAVNVDGGQRAGEAFLVLNGTRLYVLDALVSPGAEMLAQKFFQSFQLRD